MYVQVYVMRVQVQQKTGQGAGFREAGDIGSHKLLEAKQPMFSERAGSAFFLTTEIFPKCQIINYLNIREL